MAKSKKETKFERVKRQLQEHWGFNLIKNDKSNRGWWSGCCKSGYSVNETGLGHGSRWLRFNTLAEIERRYLKEHPEHRKKSK